MLSWKSPLRFKKHRAGAKFASVLDAAGAPTISDASSSSISSPDNGLGLKILYDPDDAVVDIVFVHGLTGTRESTWTHKQTKVFWPADLLRDDIANARILTFGYDANVVNFLSSASQNRIAHHAGNLIASLYQERLGTDSNHRPIVMVAHSLGGLVCKDALLSSRNSQMTHVQQIYECTRAIAFIGTPHSGAGSADWAAIMSPMLNVVKRTNSDILRVLKSDSETLARIQNDFHKMLHARKNQGKTELNIVCFYEEKPVEKSGVSVMVVPQNSAIIPGYEFIGIHNNHKDMTRFESSEDVGYKSVSRELRMWTKEIEDCLRANSNLNAPPLEGNTAGRRTSLLPVNNMWKSPAVSQVQYTFNTSGGKVVTGNNFTSRNGPMIITL